MARTPKTIVPAPEETTNAEPVVPVVADSVGSADGSVDAGDLPPVAQALDPEAPVTPEPQQEQVTQAPEAAPDFEPGQNYERAKLITFR